VIYALLAPLGLALFLAILVNSTVRILSGRGVSWKGRTIYENGGLRPPL
jgi:predicted PurR-regulated permease PerM